MANEQTEENERAAFTVKALPVEARKLAVACAAKAGETMGEWLAKAIRNQARLEAGERILPPVRPVGGALAPIMPAAAPVDIGELAGLMQAAERMAASAGVPMTKAAAQEAATLVREQIRAARGLPQKAPKQTKPKNGQTVIDGEAAPVEGA